MFVVLYRIKQAQVQKELEDAASEVRIIAFDKSCHEPQLPASSLPSKIKTQLVSCLTVKK